MIPCKRDTLKSLACARLSLQNLGPLVCWPKVATYLEVKLGELVACDYRRLLSHYRLPLVLRPLVE